MAELWPGIVQEKGLARRSRLCARTGGRPRREPLHRDHSTSRLLLRRHRAARGRGAGVFARSRPHGRGRAIRQLEWPRHGRVAGGGDRREHPAPTGRDPRHQARVQTSSFALRGLRCDAREVGRRLDAHSLVEGSLQVPGPACGSRPADRHVDGTLVWSLMFNVQADDVFRAEDHVSRRVERALQRVSRTRWPDQSIASVSTGKRSHHATLHGSEMEHAPPDLQVRGPADGRHGGWRHRPCSPARFVRPVTFHAAVSEPGSRLDGGN